MKQVRVFLSLLRVLLKSDPLFSSYLTDSTLLARIQEEYAGREDSQAMDVT